ncbi:WD repeat-containing protein 33 [Coemansia sp. RSA 1813]|nr:WD repeat-containing protein 33 [Coemansia sp. RSA 1646]KAJ1766470.1 WD repeat-containing protein 33 [Coemansia sp. RSA 1843]KAJ2088760.1 WD repeat-containing protein 33 [Coemansia sp. RSA 986]KAJ2213695.1 WD repeat-containing protein 33 [Coemansia sp. RSA 487]KAJ2568702.1 WD repeat-containing protein 33 [Coemansia sp. RSA 1813]
MPDTPPPPPPSLGQQQHPMPPPHNFQQQQNRNIGGNNQGRFPGQMYQQNPPQQMNRPYAQMHGGGGGGGGGDMGMRNPGYYPQQGGNAGMYNQRSHYSMQQRPQNGQFRPHAYKNIGTGGQEYAQQYQRFQNTNFRQGPPDSTGSQQQPHYGFQHSNAGPAQNKGNKQQMQRHTIDYYSATVRGLELRASGAPLSLKNLPADPSYIVDVFPAAFVPHEPETSIVSRYVQRAQNKERHPVNIIRWTPEGRRLVTGSSSGELTLWNGLSFNFESIMQAHDSPVRSMEWCHHGQWMITGDHLGVIKYWKPNFAFVNGINAHKAPVRDVSFSPTDTKFVSASDDQQLKVWDFGRGQEESALVGHTWEVRAVDWHPYMGMIASGGKDDVINIWDPRTTKALARLARHNNSITGLQWNPHNGNWLLSSGRDHCIKLFDVRKLKEEIKSFATTREIHSVAWHPVHETLFASGGSICNNKEPTNDGTIQFWFTDDIKPKATVEGAHYSYVWTIAWNPMGHILASGSNDRATKFWCRPRPAESLPTELGGSDVDGRIFGKPVNVQAAAKLASGAEESILSAKDNSLVGHGGLSTDANRAAPGTGGGGGSLPGLQSSDIGRMLAKIKKDGVPGLPGLGNNAIPHSTRPPLPLPSAGLPGLSRPSNLPGLSSSPRPPPPPPLSAISTSPSPLPQQQEQLQGPVRNSSIQQRQSRFNPIQRNQQPPSN